MTFVQKSCSGPALTLHSVLHEYICDLQKKNPLTTALCMSAKTLYLSFKNNSVSHISVRGTGITAVIVGGSYPSRTLL